MSAGAGFICAAVAVLCWGSNFLPVKKYDTGDGMFFQWIMCSAIWVAGLLVQLVRQTEFQPVAILGGFLWCTGNMLCVPVIQMIGMGLGLLLWGASALAFGWASGYFGLFGLNPQKASNNTMNIIGFFVALCSLGILFFVKPSTGSKSDDDNSNGDHPIESYLPVDVSPGIEQDPETYARLGGGAVNSQDNLSRTSTLIDRMPSSQKRLVGCSLAVIAGVFFGVNFDPPQYLIDHHKGSDNGVDYVFSHFCGIFLTSTVYFLVYCAYKKNKPVINPEIVLPSFISGLVWAIAQISWFYANTALALVVTMPITSTGPGIVALIWGIVFFGEVKGRRNFIVLGCAMAAVGLGVGLIAASK